MSRKERSKREEKAEAPKIDLSWLKDYQHKGTEKGARPKKKRGRR